MNPTKTKQLVNRLSESANEEDYSRVLERQGGELRRKNEKLQAMT
jgi:hypothetical protein